MLKLDKPVCFRRMDDETEDISAKMVFNLALTDSSHMEILQHLMGLFANTEKMQDLYDTDIKDLPAKLATYIKQGQESE